MGRGRATGTGILPGAADVRPEDRWVCRLQAETAGGTAHRGEPRPRACGLNDATGGLTLMGREHPFAAPARTRRFVPQAPRPHSVRDRHPGSGNRRDGTPRNRLPARAAALHPTGSSAPDPVLSLPRDPRRSGPGLGACGALSRSRGPDSAAGVVANCHWTGVGGRLSSDACFRCMGDEPARPGQAMQRIPAGHRSCSRRHYQLGRRIDSQAGGRYGGPGRRRGR